MKIAPIELKPSLSSCIEALSKKEYERTLDLLLKGGSVNEELGEKLGVLRLFLESTDFSELRKHYEDILRRGKRSPSSFIPKRGK